MKPRVVLGVSGGIAAYKAAEILRGLLRRGAEVQVVLTRGALEFVAPATFSTLSGRPVHTEVWGDRNSPAVDHVALADWADLLVVAPATAHTIGKFAQGLADDFLSTYFLAHRKGVLLAPAMETAMWTSPAVVRNMQSLRERGVGLVGPAAGPLASGHEGLGRMEEPEAIVEAVWSRLAGERDLADLALLVTAGPTREPIDPIRFVSNRSSGRMGYALAEGARDRGARVTLLSGPTELPLPAGVRLLRFETAADLQALLVHEFPECDVLIMAAAVADFIPEESAERLHREDGDRILRLAAGRDVLAGLSPLTRSQIVVAFAAETDRLEERGRAKMERKGADLIVVNDVGRAGTGFDAEENEVLILGRRGERELVSRRPKREVAGKILDAIVRVRRSASEVSR
ncbi:MAG TPA: bifunctional phosphopantothenoylcysteine decarboxylase/phosphopantothenate--cysteine ligase CoaBC [Thermoanaerobaculia bacterium]|nr:bifunctional phosphopantothenoylcysteine decarboxylase/phosphopantothenate--cysteine ligase CoaBC [Thermoanaerobaculia bacterium]